jgi:hypothetical protein
MAIAALDKDKSKTWYQDLIDMLNYAVAKGTIAAVGGTVTTALSDLATERDKH